MVEVLLFVLVALLFMIPFVVFLFTLIPLFVGAPYEGSRRDVIEKIIEFSRVKKGERVAELGSGDGRIVIEFAKRGALATGFEINPILVFYSRWKIRKEGLQKRARVKWKSFWNADLSGFDVVVLFQYRHVMSGLARKLKRELKKGSRVVSNKWKFAGWKIVKESEVGTGVVLYNG